MAAFSHDCPHCFSKNNAFEIVATHQVKSRLYTVLMVCTSCGGGLCADVEAVNDPAAARLNLKLEPGIVVHRVYPKPRPVETPGHVPDPVARCYLQAAENLRDKRAESAAIMCGKTLEIALKMLHVEGSGTLAQRIRHCPDLPEAMREWAEIVKDGRNFAAHEADPLDEETARELLSFTEVFLLYTFTLPKMVELRRHHTSSSVT